MKTLEEILRELPPELRQQVQHYAEFLLAQRAKRKQKYLRMSWRGALSDLRDEYTSVELQHKALDWWGD